MAEPALIDVGPGLLDIVLDLLRNHVPDHEVWAFGSRVKGTPKRYSDLDLAIMSDTPLPLDVRARLADAFSDSDLPWRVDLVDWATTSPAFRAIIERDKVVLQRGPSNPGWNPRPLQVVCQGMSTKEPATTNSPLPPRPNAPGGSAALPEGTLPKPFLGPQGDENRDPPPNSPAPVPPTETVKDTDPGR